MLNSREIVRFYQLQLAKFRKLQSKNIHVTEFGVRITGVLIGATERRLAELKAKLSIPVVDQPFTNWNNGEPNGRF